MKLTGVFKSDLATVSITVERVNYSATWAVWSPLVKSEKMRSRHVLQAKPSLGLCGTGDDPHHTSPVRVMGVGEELCIDLLFSEIRLLHKQLWRQTAPLVLCLLSQNKDLPPLELADWPLPAVILSADNDLILRDPPRCTQNHHSRCLGTRNHTTAERIQTGAHLHELLRFSLVPVSPDETLTAWGLEAELRFYWHGARGFRCDRHHTGPSWSPPPNPAAETQMPMFENTAGGRRRRGG